MLRDVKQQEWENGTVTVTLITGHTYKNCDYPYPPFSDTTPTVVSFWHNNQLLNIPIDRVHSVIFTFPE